MEMKWILLAVYKEEMLESYCELGEDSLRYIKSKKSLVQAFRLKKLLRYIY
jgi:hypothetical protein